MAFLLTHQFIKPALQKDIHLGFAIINCHINDIGQIFKEWDVNPPELITPIETVIKALQLIGVNFSQLDLSIIRTASKLASEKNENPYHSNTHFLKVFVLSALLGADAFKERRINLHHLCILLSAALIHDYKHDGTQNEGQRYRLEEIALNAAENDIKNAGATPDDWELFRAFIRTTDVSKDFSNTTAISPAESVKKFSLSRNPEDLPPELYILAETNTADIALMLEDADLSNGLLDVQSNIASGMAIAQEQKIPYEISSQIFFLEKICHRQAFSVSGQHLLQPKMNEMLSHYGLQPTSLGPNIFSASP